MPLSESRRSVTFILLNTVPGLDGLFVSRVLQDRICICIYICTDTDGYMEDGQNW